jgi:NagD protein
MIRSVTGCRLTVTGKPSLDALRAAAARLGVPARDLVVVGDDPLLEVPMARRGHALAVAVQTGLAGPGAYDHLPPAKQPHLHLRGIDELLSLYREQGQIHLVRTTSRFFPAATISGGSA